METIRHRSSVVFIGTRRGLEVYSSLETAPPKVRRRVTELTQDSRAYTLVIADRAGREELMRALGEPLAQEKDSAEVEKPRESRIVLKQQLSFYLLAGAVVAAALLFCLSH